MAKIRSSGRKGNAQEDNTPISKKIMKDVVAVYVFFMFAIYPLYYEDKYYNMGDAKWHFFKWVTIVGVIAMTAAFIWYQTYLGQAGKLGWYWDYRKNSILDWFVLAYAIAALTSFLMSPYKSDTLIGYSGWYMGLIAQLAFVFLYYFMSRFWRWDDLVLIIYLSVSAAIFLVCVLNRFRIDPLEMYVGLSENYYLQFISTLGQATWFSSYMVLLFPLGLFVYWKTDSLIKRILSGAYVLLGAVTMIAQNSDSAFLAYLTIYLVLFVASFEDNVRMERFLESLCLLFCGWKIMGVLQVAFEDRVLVLSELMRFLSIGVMPWVLFAVSFALYIACRKLVSGGDFEIQNYKWLRNTILITIACAGAVLVAYVAMNSLGVFDGTSLASDNNYLLFNEAWGSDRGLSWMAAIGTFAKTNIMRKLFGAGPDGFSDEVYRFYSGPLREKWGENTILSCAHNEWLNSLVCVGLLGAIAYIGIFISGLLRFLKKSVTVPETVVPAMCIGAYMVHNFFCYQQIICTPVIFMIIGAGEALCKYGRVEIWEPDGD